MISSRTKFSVLALSSALIATLSFVPTAFANDAPDMPPLGCEASNSLECFYNTTILINLGDFANQLVAIKDDGAIGPGSCGGNQVTQLAGQEFSWPTILSGDHIYLVRRDYFEKAGGIPGLFEQRKISYISHEYCGTKTITVMDKKNPAEFAENSLRILVPKTDKNIWNHGAYGSEIKLKPWNETFLEAPLDVSDYHGVTIFPDSTKEKRFYYRASGYLCDSSLCQMAISLTKEEQVSDSGATKTIASISQQFPQLIGSLPTPPVTVSPTSPEIIGQFSTSTDYWASFIFDIASHKNDLVLIRKKPYYDTRNSYEVIREAQFEWGSGEYLAIRKDYFDKNGGIDGLFPLKETKKTTYGYNKVWGPKDETELRHNSFEFALLSTEQEKKLWTWSTTKTYDKKIVVEPECGTAFTTVGGNFLALNPKRKICTHREDPKVDPAIENINYFYRSGGFFCEDSLCWIVMYREREEFEKPGVFSYRDVTQWRKTIVEKAGFEKPKLASASNSMPAVPAASSTQAPVNEPTFSQPTDTSPPAPEMPQPRPWWSRIWCSFISLFGASC